MIAEGRETLIDSILATSVLIGFRLDYLLDRWRADQLAGLVIVFYAIREAAQSSGGAG
jgi:divalent metal cation (Fe/Co/Zn/Cd) transporter